MSFDQNRPGNRQTGILISQTYSRSQAPGTRVYARRLSFHSWNCRVPSATPVAKIKNQEAWKSLAACRSIKTVTT